MATFEPSISIDVSILMTLRGNEERLPTPKWQPLGLSPNSLVPVTSSYQPPLAFRRDISLLTRGLRLKHHEHRIRYLSDI